MSPMSSLPVAMSSSVVAIIAKLAPSMPSIWLTAVFNASNFSSSDSLPIIAVNATSPFADPFVASPAFFCGHALARCPAV